MSALELVVLSVLPLNAKSPVMIPVIVSVSPDTAVVMLDVPAILNDSPRLIAVPVLSSPTRVIDVDATPPNATPSTYCLVAASPLAVGAPRLVILAPLKLTDPVPEGDNTRSSLLLLVEILLSTICIASEYNELVLTDSADTVPDTNKSSAISIAEESSELKLLVITLFDFSVPDTVTPSLICTTDESSLCITLVYNVGVETDPVTINESLMVILVLSSELITLSVIRIFFNSTAPDPLGWILIVPLVVLVVII